MVYLPRPYNGQWASAMHPSGKGLRYTKETTRDQQAENITMKKSGNHTMPDSKG